MGSAYITGVGMTAFGRFYERSLKDLAREAISVALKDADLELDDIQAVYFSNALAGIMLGQECIRGETICYDLGMDSVPVVNVENACASGGTALHLAAEAVRSGQFETVLAVGAEKMYDRDDRSRPFRALWGALDVELVPLPDPGQPLLRSPFIDVYAERARNLMRTRGVSPEGFARVAAKAWANGALNPRAQRTTPRTVEEILASRMLVEPLTVDMCALTGDGAGAAIVSSRQPASGRPTVQIRGSQIRALSPRPGAPGAAAAASTAAYEQAGIGPEDISIAEVHDATAAGEMLSWVGVGLCPAGDEEAWAQSGRTERDGATPVNVSGGLMARGHPVGASGLGQVYELVRQLRGEAGSTQIRPSRVALAHVGGGVINGETAVACVNLLAI
jgi:acetyl-CoA acetyltransferase